MIDHCWCQIMSRKLESRGLGKMTNRNWKCWHCQVRRQLVIARTGVRPMLRRLGAQSFRTTWMVKFCILMTIRNFNLSFRVAVAFHGLSQGFLPLFLPFSHIFTHLSSIFLPFDPYFPTKTDLETHGGSYATRPRELVTTTAPGGI